MLRLAPCLRRYGSYSHSTLLVSPIGVHLPGCGRPVGGGDLVADVGGEVPPRSGLSAFGAATTDRGQTHLPDGAVTLVERDPLRGDRPGRRRRRGARADRSEDD